MGCHLIALGGTGQKTLEMLGYACACDALYTLDDDLRRQPLDVLSVLTVDTAPQVPDALTRYQALRQVFAIGGQPRVGFHTQIEIDHLAIVPQERPSVQANATERDRLLLETLFASDLAALDLHEGLKGHADLGMFFFADALSRLSEQLAQGEEHPFFDRIRQELDAGEDVKVLLAGSVYGGTGMSGIPSMAMFLRGQFASERLILGAVLTLPPHDPRTGDELNARAAAALYHYGQTGLMRHASVRPDGAFGRGIPRAPHRQPLRRQLRPRSRKHAGRYAAAGFSLGAHRITVLFHAVSRRICGYAGAVSHPAHVPPAVLALL